MKVKIFIIILIFAITVFIHGMQLIDDILHSLYEQDYEKALFLADSGLSMENKIPYYYLKTGIFTTYMSDFETDKYNDSLFYYFEIVKSMEAKTAFDYFFKGGVYFQKASYFALNGYYIEALKHSLKAKTFFSKAIEIDSTLYDAYLGMGLYDYFLSKFKSKISFHKNSHKGIKYIKQAALNGLFSKVPAFDMLAIIYTYEGEYDSALYYIKAIRKDYPENRMFLFSHYKLYLQMKDYENAFYIIDTLTNRIENTLNENMYNLAYCYYNKALMLYYNNRYKEAIEYAYKTINIKYNDKRVKKFINNARKLIKKINKN